MCTHLLTNEKITDTFAIKLLKTLAFDKIVNTKITLAKVISKVFKNKNKGNNLIINL